MAIKIYSNYYWYIAKNLSLKEWHYAGFTLRGTIGMFINRIKLNKKCRKLGLTESP